MEGRDGVPGLGPDLVGESKGADDLAVRDDVEDDRPLGPPGLGDRLLVKFQRGGEGWEARLIKKLDVGTNRVLGVIRKSARETRVEPVDRRSKDVLLVPQAQSGDLRDGDVRDADRDNLR